MSLDFVIYKFPDYPLTADVDIRDKEQLPLGTVAEVRDLISAQLPETEWESYWTGYYLGKESRLDFYVGSYDSDEEDLLNHLDIVVHGGGEDMFDLLFKVAHPYHWTIQEMSEGQLILPVES
ncbi:MAG: hypothetical protein JAY64_08600 [Candidatus Thiodiazotropha weberae]|nr:hypothetical protein [Candidatus Thiodiazotropha lotti]MCG8011747.1 hypothetical protein [Candidatus Thiodiazotropha lotti]MCW4211213.1 hypothetical protein [Candidatus Thiodiazotropha lotti]MCW4218084.1 hypothetical protein [Candidatus Thiodiazotropha lotti]